MNLAILIGNLGRDPEMRYTASGMAVCNFSIATTKRVKGENHTEWHKCVCFQKTAELVAQYLQKGSKCSVTGEIQTRSWDKDGVTQYSTEILVNNIEFLDSKKSEGYKPPVSDDMSKPKDIIDDDIPF